ncbi:MAG: polysaccharide deacetylase family protein [Synergistaceae bacterium]|nr:polysaccharide deacetylase family protein [Synergistaceae bacterium]
MKVLKIFIISILIFIFSFPAFSAEKKDVWQADELDARRAIPNNITPPDKLEPENILPPLKTNEGIIRRVKIPDGERVVALTFDTCELATITTGCDMNVINFLRINKIPATFFMGGKWMRTHSRRVKQIMSEHELFEIANHNWSHGNCALLSETELKNQILWTQAEYEILRNEFLHDFYDPQGIEALDEVEELQKKIPLVPTLFRLPYGRNNEKALKIISELGLRIIQWDVAAEAGDNSDLKHAQKSAKKVAAMTKPGSILLFHANSVPKGTANLLRFVVEELKSQGYSFVKVSKLLELGEVETVRNGYFTTPGDNLSLDKDFGIDGTGRKSK